MANIIAKLISLLVGSGTSLMPPEDAKAVMVYLKCSKCHEPISLRIRKSDELQRDFDNNGYTFFVQKLVMGSKCYNRIPIRLELDEKYRIVNQTITGGEFISREEFEALSNTEAQIKD